MLVLGVNDREDIVVEHGGERMLVRVERYKGKLQACMDMPKSFAVWRVKREEKQ